MVRLLFMLCFSFYSIAVYCQQEAWAIQHTDEGLFDYYSNSNDGFQLKLFDEHQQKERGSIITFFKTWVADEGEFMIRFAKQPPGITYLNEPWSLEQHLNELLVIYKGTMLEKQFIQHSGHNAMDASFVNDKYHIFTRTIIRGSQMVLLFQALDINGEIKKFDPFFNKFSFSSPKSADLYPYTFNASQFEMLLPENYYVIPQEDNNQIVENISFSEYQTWSTIDLEINKIDPYTGFDFSDKYFKYENLVDTQAVDSLLLFKTGKYKNVCPMFKLEHMVPGNKKYISEMYVYCNGYKHDLILTIPLPYRGSRLIDTIFESVEIKLDEKVNQQMLSGKKDVTQMLLNDLWSTDRAVYDEAMEKLYDYEGITEKEIPSILTALKKPTPYEEDEFNARYYLVTAIHQFESPAIEKGLEAIFSSSTNYNLRSRILESLSLRQSSGSKDAMLRLLKSAAAESYELKMSAFDGFADSLQLFSLYKSRLVDLAQNNIGRKEIIDAYSSAIGYYGKDNAIAVDSLTYEKMVNADLETWFEGIKVDDEAGIPMHVINYFVVFDRPDVESKIESLLRSSNSTFNHYRLVYNTVSKGKIPANEDLDKVYTDNYYWYYILSTLIRKDMLKSIPAAYKPLEKNVSTMMHHYYYDNQSVDCQKFEIKRMVDTKYGKMALTTCTDGNPEGEFIGIVGPFFADGTPDLANEQSLYFEEKQMGYDLEDRLQVLLDNLQD